MTLTEHLKNGRLNASKNQYQDTCLTLYPIGRGSYGTSCYDLGKAVRWQIQQSATVKVADTIPEKKLRRKQGNIIG